MPQDRRKNIALTGFMAVGKSTVGRRLARRLKRPFVDLDHAIEAKEGISVEEIFSRKGETHFRRVEKATLKEILRGDEQVIATGGGAIMDEGNLRLLRDRSLLIHLTASPQSLLRRSGPNSSRPLLKGSHRLERIEDLLAQRDGAYRQAHISIDTSALSVNKVVEKIIEEMRLQQGEGANPGARIQKPEAGKTDNSEC